MEDEAMTIENIWKLQEDVLQLELELSVASAALARMLVMMSVQEDLIERQGKRKAAQDEEIWKLEEENQLLVEEMQRYTARMVQ
jgi:hypothetical protein